MALIKSNVLAQISGSVNGLTFSHNSGGAYIRNRSLPTNPGTDRQDQVRTALASISSTWKYTLTVSQREMWRIYGQAMTVINRLGDPIKLSGIAAFQHINLFRMSTLGEPLLLDPPGTPTRDAAPAFSSVQVISPVGDPVELAITMTDSGGSEYGMAYYVSGPISAGIRFYRGPYLTRGDVVAGLATFSVPTEIDANTYGGQANVAAKLTLYHIATSTPVWTVYIDGTPIPEVTP